MVLEVGKHYQFHYWQGHTVDFRRGKVVNVRDCWARPLTKQSFRFNLVPLRSRYLVTIKQPNGEYRNMYYHAMDDITYLSLWTRFKTWIKGFFMPRSPKMQSVIDNFSNALFGRKNSESIRDKVCVDCGTPVKMADFRNAISRKEFEISGLCMKCQDSVFGVD